MSRYRRMTGAFYGEDTCYHSAKLVWSAVAPHLFRCWLFSRRIGYWANLSESFGNVSKMFGDHSFIYVIPTYHFRIEISLRILENARSQVCDNIMSRHSPEAYRKKSASQVIISSVLVYPGREEPRPAPLSPFHPLSNPRLLVIVNIGRL